jgi:dolichyl-phosphate-mannose-protein mannosyltransferase
VSVNLRGTGAKEPLGEIPPRDESQPSALQSNGLDRWYVSLVLILLLATILRAWGIKHGLPFIYNPDERGHFVPRAVSFFRDGYNPHYFVNPPAFTYFVHIVLAAWYRSGARAAHAYLSNPTQVFLIARLSAAALGVLAVWLLYLTGDRIFGRPVGLLAAGVMAVAFLPVFYSHQSLNDTPTLVPVTLSLYGAAGVLRRGGRLDYAISGIGVGLGAATKYMAAIAVLPLLAATAVDIRNKGRWRGPLEGLVLAAVGAVASFIAANPYSILDHNSFLSELNKLSPGRTAAGPEKLGQTPRNGIIYYLWTLTWGLGWVPVVAALGGAFLLLKKDRASAAVLVPAPILFLLYMGSQSRRLGYFGRWIMPIFPMLILLSAYAVSQLLSFVLPRIRGFAPVVAGLAVVALMGQGLITSVHTDVVLTRTNTAALARQWIFGHIPPGSLMVVEPIYLLLEPTGEDPGGLRRQRNLYARWEFFDVRLAVIRGGLKTRDETLAHRVTKTFERLLRPGLITLYERAGACWIVTGSYQWGRAFSRPDQVPQAIAYYRELSKRAKIMYRITPYRAGHGSVPFNFDWSSDYYPLAFGRPGPEIIIYRLTGRECS